MSERKEAVADSLEGNSEAFDWSQKTEGVGAQELLSLEDLSDWRFVGGFERKPNWKVAQSTQADLGPLRDARSPARRHIPDLPEAWSLGEFPGFPREAVDLASLDANQEGHPPVAG